jgi:CBS-domain-containing membrane protein
MGLRDNILREPVSKLPIRPAVTVKATTKVREAAARMKQAHLGCVIVVDRAGKPVGKFTERKLMKVLLQGPAGLDKPVKSFMYPTGDPVSAHAPIAEMLRIMQSRQLRFISVVDQKGKVVGLTGQKGLMEYITEFFPRQVKSQRMGPLLSMPEREGA